MRVMKSVALMTAMSLASCASIVSKANWPVAVTTHPSGAEVSIYNESDELVHTGKSPFTVTLDASAGFFSGETYRMGAVWPDGARGGVVVDSMLNGWYVGNIVFGGVLGLLVVDPATGAMWRLPESATIFATVAGRR